MRLERSTAERLPWPDDHFDGATTVNSIQLWDPPAASAAEVARVLRPGARLVTVTHDWVLKDVEALATTLTDNGFADVRHHKARADEGRATVLFAVAR